MAAGEQRDQRPLDDNVLSNDDCADAVANIPDKCRDLFGRRILYVLSQWFASQVVSDSVARRWRN
jgi:hypothetical protein